MARHHRFVTRECTPQGVDERVWNDVNRRFFLIKRIGGGEQGGAYLALKRSLFPRGLQYCTDITPKLVKDVLAKREAEVLKLYFENDTCNNFHAEIWVLSNEPVSNNPRTPFLRDYDDRQLRWFTQTWAGVSLESISMELAVMSPRDRQRLAWELLYQLGEVYHKLRHADTRIRIAHVDNVIANVCVNATQGPVPTTQDPQEATADRVNVVEAMWNSDKGPVEVTPDLRNATKEHLLKEKGPSVLLASLIDFGRVRTLSKDRLPRESESLRWEMGLWAITIHWVAHGRTYKAANGKLAETTPLRDDTTGRFCTCTSFSRPKRFRKSHAERFAEWQSEHDQDLTDLLERICCWQDPEQLDDTEVRKLLRTRKYRPKFDNKPYDVPPEISKKLRESKMSVQEIVSSLVDNYFPEGRAQSLYARKRKYGDDDEGPNRKRLRSR
ncbi:MAG: hypothetical protein Q9162_000814 [Coniocarpon cinnabarinum]